MIRTIIVSLLFAISLSATVINVPADQATIQAGIDAADFADTVLVHPGTYIENLNIVGKNLTLASLLITTYDTSYINQTIIDGGQLSSVLYFSNAAPKIIGLTIQNGHSSDYGGGIRGGWDNSNIDLFNCVVRNNTAENEGGGIWVWGSNITLNIQNSEIYANTARRHGGGVFANAGASVNIDQTNIVGNSAIEQSGGGISSWESITAISNCSINNNYAYKYGGGIRLQEAELTLTNSTMEGNQADCQGGAIAPRSSNLLMTNVSFQNNSITDSCGYGAGGAIAIFEQDTVLTERTIEITDCLFSGNISENNTGGLDIRKGSGTDSVTVNITIGDCEFIDNSAVKRGGMQVTGVNTYLAVENCSFIGNEVLSHTSALGVYSGVEGVISNCIFANNVSSLNDTLFDQSGAIVITDRSNIGINNCTIVDNQSDVASGLFVGGGGNVTINNSILWSDEIYPIKVYSWEGVPGILAISYSDIKDGLDSINVDSLSLLTWSDGNLAENPLFCYPEGGIYTLASNSPCVGSGGGGTDIGAFEVGCGPTVSIKKDQIVPSEYTLDQNYPNPFNPSTTLRYGLPEEANVSLVIYDVRGQVVQTLESRHQSAGWYDIIWNGETTDGKTISTGIYFARLVAGDYSQVIKMLYLK